VLKESLQMDFTKIGQEYRLEASGESYVDQRGSFWGCNFEIGPKDSIEQLSLAPKEGRLSGFYTRTGSSNEVDQPWKSGTFFWDAYMVDQLEIYLALHDLEIGTRFDDSLFSPQALSYVRVRGQVTWFMWQEIFKGKMDSVFVIKLTEPGNCQLFFMPDKKLVKVDFQDMKIRVYQDEVRQVKKSVLDATNQSNAPESSVAASFSVRALIFKLPHYAAFLIIAAIVLLMFATKGFKWPVAYLGLGVGIAVYLLMPLVVHPLLLIVARDWLGIGNPTASGFYVRGATFALVSGLIQAALVFAGIVLVERFTKPPVYRIAGLAAFVGAGFALAEAVYVSGWQITILFEWSLLERACFIALFIATGALIGRLLKENLVLAIWGGLGAAVAIAVVRFFPILVQGRIVDVQLMHFILAIWVAVFLVVVLMLSRKTYERPGEDETTETPELQS